MEPRARGPACPPLRDDSDFPMPRSAAKTPASPATAAAVPVVSPTPDVAVPHYLAAYLMGLANRLANGASAHYRANWNIGMSEWRALMAIGPSTHLIARGVAARPDLENAAASKSLRLLKERGYVELEQTARRGGATLVRLTPAGLALFGELQATALQRQDRLLAAFTDDETRTLWSLLHKLHWQIPAMNAEERPAVARSGGTTKATATSPAPRAARKAASPVAGKATG